MRELEIVIPELRMKFLVKELLDGVEELSTRPATPRTRFERKEIARTNA
jgi:hypothetical protein